jgi:SAM-dependent methyltransferase
MTQEPNVVQAVASVARRGVRLARGLIGYANAALGKGAPVAAATPVAVAEDSRRAPQDSLSALGDRFPELITRTHAAIPDGEHDKYRNQIIHLLQLQDSVYRHSYNVSVVRIVEAMTKQVTTATKAAPVVLDFGCWSGTTSRYISDVLGVGCVGAEIDQVCLEFARHFLASPRVSFIDVDLHGIQCADAGFDVVLANAVFANMHETQHDRMVAELARVTKPGGALIIIDSNSPGSPEVQGRLRTLYQELESEGGWILEKRREYIDRIWPDKAPNYAAAQATCYATKDEIDAFIAGQRAPTPFDPQSLVAPSALNAPRWSPSTLTDANRYARVLKEAGLEVSVGPSWPTDTPVTTESGFVLVGRKPSS